MIFFKELIENVEKAHAMELPFVVYRKPESGIISCWIQQDREVHFLQDYNASGFVMAPFLHANKPIFFPDKNVKIYTCQDDSQPANEREIPDSEFGFKGLHKDKVRHLKLIEEGIDAIRHNEVFKVVLSREEVIELDEFDLVVIFKKLLRTYPAAFTYVWYHPEIGLWIGASPETLIMARGDRFSTMALAGTKSFSEKKEIIWGEKEIKEQQFVTDHIVKELSGIAIEVGSPYNKNAGNLVHICTDIHGKLAKNQDLNTLIKSLHPTAAVCGLPKNKAVEFIATHEDYDRAYYTGFLGEINYTHAGEKEACADELPETNLFVNLRCMRILLEPKPTATLYIGGGITEGSVPESEWEETVAKSKVMKAVLYS